MNAQGLQAKAGRTRVTDGKSRSRKLCCVLPRDTAHELQETLRTFYDEDPSVEVIVDFRKRERRRRERRNDDMEVGDERDRRKIRGKLGRRVADRRAIAMPVDGPNLPRKAKRYADRIVFLERLEPRTLDVEDSDTGRLIARFQSGDESIFTELYMRYFDRLYTYLRVALRDSHEAEDVSQQVFLKVLEALPRYELRAGKPFRAWLFRIARNELLGHMRRSKRVDVEEPEAIDRRRDIGGDELDGPALEFVSDVDLLVLIERLPDTQRQTIMLRYMLGMATEEIAQVLDRTPVAVRKLEHRALRFLEHRLGPLRQQRELRVNRSAMVVRLRPDPVVNARRFALGAAGKVRAA